MRQVCALILALGFTTNAVAAIYEKPDSTFSVTLHKTKKKSYLSNKTSLKDSDALTFANTDYSPKIEVVELEAIPSVPPVLTPEDSEDTQFLASEEKAQTPEVIVEDVSKKEIPAVMAPTIPQQDPQSVAADSEKQSGVTKENESEELDLADDAPTVTSQSLTTVVEEPDYIYSRKDLGFRLSVYKPALSLTVVSELKDYDSQPLRMDHELDTQGIGFGMTYLPEHKFGWTSNLSLLQISDGGSATIGRYDANVGYKFSKKVDIKAGFNGSRFMSGSRISGLFPGIGYQASLGLNVYQNVGIDIGYLSMRQVGYVESKGSIFFMEAVEQGMDIQLHTSF